MEALNNGVCCLNPISSFVRKEEVVYALTEFPSSIGKSVMIAKYGDVPAVAGTFRYVKLHFSFVR